MVDVSIWEILLLVMVFVCGGTAVYVGLCAGRRRERSAAASLSRGQVSPELRQVVDAVPDPILVIDRQHRVLLANASARSLLTTDPVMAGLMCYQVLHHETEPCHDKSNPCPLPQVIETRAPVCVRHVHPGLTGEPRTVEEVATPVFDEQGEVVRMIAVCHDITDHVRAEERVRQENTKFSALLAALDEGVALADPDGRVIEVNDTFCHFAGKDRTELVGQMLGGCHPDGLCGRIRAEAARLRHDLAAIPTAIQETMGNEELLVRVRPIRSGETYFGTLLCVSNVTEVIQARKAAEQAAATLAERTRELEAARTAVVNMVDDLQLAPCPDGEGGHVPPRRRRRPPAAQKNFPTTRTPGDSSDAAPSPGRDS